MRKLLILLAPLTGMTSFAQLDFNNLLVGKYGVGFGLRYNGSMQIGVSLNDRFFTGLGTSGTDIGVTFFTDATAFFKESELGLRVSSTFGQTTGFGTGISLDAMLVNTMSADVAQRIFAVGAHITPGYVSPKGSITGNVGVAFPLNLASEFRPRLGLGLGGGYAPARVGFSSASLLGSGQYVINDWKQRDPESDTAPPLDVRTVVHYHF